MLGLGPGPVLSLAVVNGFDQCELQNTAVASTVDTKVFKPVQKKEQSLTQDPSKPELKNFSL